jgi:hypothetical protein
VRKDHETSVGAAMLARVAVNFTCVIDGDMSERMSHSHYPDWKDADSSRNLLQLPLCRRPEFANFQGYP